MQKYQPGEHILIRGIVGRDGVVLAPGVEIGQGCLHIVGDVPRFEQADRPCMVVLFFAGEADRMRCVEEIARNSAIEVTDIRTFHA